MPPLPWIQPLAKRLARHAGLRKLRPEDGIRYRADFDHHLTPKLRWEAATQCASSGAQLALRLREFDEAVGWEAMRKPASEAGDPEYFHATIFAGRAAAAAVAPAIAPQAAVAAAAGAVGGGAERGPGSAADAAEAAKQGSGAGLQDSKQVVADQQQQQQQQKNAVGGEDGVREYLVGCSVVIAGMPLGLVGERLYHWLCALAVFV